MSTLNRARLFRWGVGGVVGGSIGTAVVIVSAIKEDIKNPQSSASFTNNGSSVTKDVMELGSVGVASGLTLTKVAGFALSGIGFTEAGVAAKSIAAALHAKIGNVAAGSIFAKLQAAGAAKGIAVFGPGGIGAAVVVGGGFAIYKVQRYRAERRRKEEELRNKQLCYRIKKLVWGLFEGRSK